MDFPSSTFSNRISNPDRGWMSRRCAREKLERTGLLNAVKPGQTVLITAGSRGVGCMVEVLAAVAAAVKDKGGRPLILPAMGSHGGGTAAGADRGARAPRADRRNARGARSTTAWNRSWSARPRGVRSMPTARRSKPTTSSSSTASRSTRSSSARSSPACSRWPSWAWAASPGPRSCTSSRCGSATSRPSRRWPGSCSRSSRSSGGVAILEDKTNTVRRLEAVPAAAVFEREPQLLAEARQHHAALPFDQLDVLLVDEIGKDISGRRLRHQGDRPDHEHLREGVRAAAHHPHRAAGPFGQDRRQRHRPGAGRLRAPAGRGPDGRGHDRAQLHHGRRARKRRGSRSCCPPTARRSRPPSVRSACGTPASVRMAWIINTSDLSAAGGLARPGRGGAAPRGSPYPPERFALPFDRRGELPGLRDVLAGGCR